MAGAPPPNFANRTMWTRDNLDVLRGLNSESVDLVYADPPFNSNKNYQAPIGSKAAGAAFKDTWTLSDVDVAWHGEIAEREPRVYAAIDAAGIVHGKGMKSYLVMMAVRLLELRRVLKPTGSLYLHCDPTANAYLRVLLVCRLSSSMQNSSPFRPRENAIDPGKVQTKLCYESPGRHTRCHIRPGKPAKRDRLAKVQRRKEQRYEQVPNAARHGVLLHKVRVAHRQRAA